MTKLDPVTGSPNYYVKAVIDRKTDISNYYIGVINLEVDPKTVVNSLSDLVQYADQNLAKKARLSSWRYNDYYLYMLSFIPECYKDNTNYIGRGFVVTDKGDFLWTEPYNFKFLKK